MQTQLKKLKSIITIEGTNINQIGRNYIMNLENAASGKAIDRVASSKAFKRNKILGSANSDLTKAVFLLAPAFLFILIFTIYPVFNALYLSFFKLDLATPKPLFIGFGNYIDLFNDKIFTKVMGNSIWFAITTVSASMIIGLIFALVLNSSIKGRGFVRTSFFYPTVIPMIAVANVWMFMYTREYGLFARAFRFFGLKEVNWLGSADNVMWAMIIMMIWKEAGYLMVFFMAGLQNIPIEYYQAANLDGANSIKVFRYITLPLLMPTFLFVFIIATTNSFKMVDHLIIMTQGGPDNASNLLLFHIYEVAFGFWNTGKASALTTIMLVIILAVSVAQFRVIDRNIHYN